MIALSVIAAFVAAASLASFHRGRVLERQADSLRGLADIDELAGQWTEAISARYDAFQTTEQSAAWMLLGWTLIVVLTCTGVVAGLS